MTLISPSGLSYKPFQAAAIKQIIQQPATLLADEPGLGKTVQAVGVIDNTPDINKILVICPASVKLNWNRELINWLTKWYSINTIQGRSAYHMLNPEIIIINYDILFHHEWVTYFEWDLLIVDESQYLAYLDSKRVEIFSQIKAKQVLCMSATPADKVVKFWPVLHKLMPKRFNDYRRYLYRYCDAKKRTVYYTGKGGIKKRKIVLDINGASNTKELNHILRDSGVLIRRYRKDVLDFFPKVQRQLIPFDIVSQEENDFYRWTGLPWEEAAKLLETCASKSKSARIRKQTGLAKMDLISDFLTGINHKVVASGFHREVLERLHAGFRDRSALIYGGMSAAKKELAKKSFTNNPNIDILFIQNKAGGIGIDGLQEVCNHIVFIEIDWSADIMEQNEGRLDRIGQTADTILAQYLVADKTVEAYVAQKALAKREMKQELFKGGE
jgi:SNF2 family DNA or RNA helicase